MAFLLLHNYMDFIFYKELQTIIDEYNFQTE